MTTSHRDTSCRESSGKIEGSRFLHVPVDNGSSDADDSF